ncbi:pantoate--beta-alanine ligase [Solirhodobacter olei]|uniref:pantoate--beta-alanine ligase n=1 Tax=Solirhodobacter olei TaxID=2493082 RepID=UPI000FD96E66|nr:pantoate--beta-alanine ligase [Solirhodobacter olei]
MLTLRTRRDLRQAIADWGRAGERIAVVPTMGALHDGHLSLVDAARQAAERVIATIFVNPKQFNSPQDLELYPRTEEEDRAKLAVRGVDIAYVPDVAEIYPEGFATAVSVSGVTEGLCGASRPGHFDGVATVVAKLLLQTRADLAFFGEKDFQQLQVIRRLVRDLDLQVRIVGCPTVRDTNGLALSSRNARLSTEALARATALFRALKEAAARIADGEQVAIALAAAAAVILASGYSAIDYLEFRSEDGLEPMSIADRPARLCCAAWIDGVRLIDNVPVAAAMSAQSDPNLSVPESMNA